MKTLIPHWDALWVYLPLSEVLGKTPPSLGHRFGRRRYYLQVTGTLAIRGFPDFFVQGLHQVVLLFLPTFSPRPLLTSSLKKGPLKQCAGQQFVIFYARFVSVHPRRGWHFRTRVECFEE